ncbi:MAG TPA: ABC transporter permease [Nevskiaceae bacterium]|nr:ABC transporter permease [Nevskiaceae bacterium]
MLRQLFAVSLMNLRSLPARWGTASVVVICLAGVAGVMVSMLAMAEGFDSTFRRAGRADRVIVLTTGETYEAASSIARDQVTPLLSAPGLRQLPDGKPAAVIERLTMSALPLARSGRDGNLLLRGVSEKAWEVRPEVHIVAGRNFTPGLRELVVGRTAQSEFTGLQLGGTVSLSGIGWTVVGIFASGGSAFESEAWADLEVVMDAYHQPSYSSITALLQSAAAFQQYKDAVTTNPQLNHSPIAEPDFYAAQGGTLATAMRVVGWLVAVIMSLGALFAAINTLYASVESRTVEIATLRALGFGSAPVIGSVLLEAIVLCVIGAVTGGVLAYLLFNGYTVSTLGGANFTQIQFAFAVTPALFAQGVLWSCGLGLIGGVPPAVSAARLPVAEALRGG